MKTPKTKTKSWCCNVPAEQGDLKTQGKLSKPGTCCCQVQDTLCGPAKSRSQKTKKYRVSFFQGHNSPAKTFQIWLSEECQTEAASAAAQHPDTAQKLQQQPAGPALGHRDTLTPVKSGQSFICNHLIKKKKKIAFAATVSHQQQLQRRYKLFSTLLAPYTRMLAQAHASLIMVRTGISQPI